MFVSFLAYAITCRHVFGGVFGSSPAALNSFLFQTNEIPAPMNGSP